MYFNLAIFPLHSYPSGVTEAIILAELYREVSKKPFESNLHYCHNYKYSTTFNL